MHHAGTLLLQRHVWWVHGGPENRFLEERLSCMSLESPELFPVMTLTSKRHLSHDSGVVVRNQISGVPLAKLRN